MRIGRPHAARSPEFSNRFVKSSHSRAARTLVTLFPPASPMSDELPIDPGKLRDLGLRREPFSRAVRTQGVGPR